MINHNRILSGLAASLLLVCGPALGNYADTEGGRAFIDSMVSEHDFDRDEVTGWLREATRRDNILDAISSPAERTLNWDQYRNIFITDERIERGGDFMQEHADTLARAQDKMGVPAEIVTAIIGVETFYGRRAGDHRVIDALTTLAFDYPPRSRFFRSELEQYLLLTREQGLDPLALKGSYAGAMGYGQFISSSYRHYAVDFDGDGVADILNNPVDAIGSVANYIAEHRWQAGAPIAERVSVPDDLDAELIHDGLNLAHRVAEFRAAGIEPEKDVADDDRARLLKLDGPDGEEHWLVYNNFYAITRYNHSDLYAMAVYELSRNLAQEADDQ